MLILGVESSCDDTAAAVLKDGKTILSNVVSSQDQVHGPYGGVVPELASRQHIQSVLPIVDGALKNAGVSLSDIDGIAVTYGPGLVGSLLVGLSFVKGLSFRTGIPYVGVNHLEAHLLAIHLEHEVAFPYVALLASGGHTLLYTVRGVGEYLFLGGTRDDAAGEAYDKVAKLLGLGYPGGPVIDRLARQGRDDRFKFPVTRLTHADRNDPRATGSDLLPAAVARRTDFSFSGLKTAVARYQEKWASHSDPVGAVHYSPPQFSKAYGYRIPRCRDTNRCDMEV